MRNSGIRGIIPGNSSCHSVSGSCIIAGHFCAYLCGDLWRLNTNFDLHPQSSTMVCISTFILKWNEIDLIKNKVKFVGDEFNFLNLQLGFSWFHEFLISAKQNYCIGLSRLLSPALDRLCLTIEAAAFLKISGMIDEPIINQENIIICITGLGWEIFLLFTSELMRRCWCVWLGTSHVKVHGREHLFEQHLSQSLQTLPCGIANHPV